MTNLLPVLGGHSKKKAKGYGARFTVTCRSSSWLQLVVFTMMEGLSVDVGTPLSTPGSSAPVTPRKDLDLGDYMSEAESGDGPTTEYTSFLTAVPVDLRRR